MSKLTANWHYVWQHYLRAWARPKQLWCKRIDQAEPFPTTPRNVGSGRYFYEFLGATFSRLWTWNRQSCITPLAISS
jgi:hypothetical protein